MNIEPVKSSYHHSFHILTTPNNSFERTARWLAPHQCCVISLRLRVERGQPLSPSVMFLHDLEHKLADTKFPEQRLQRNQLEINSR